MDSPILVEGEKNKKKGLLALLLNLFGGSKRNLSLVLFFGGLAALSIGGAAVTGRLKGLTGAPSGRSGAGNGLAGSEGLDDAFSVAAPVVPALTPEELRLKALAATVSGKARSERNDAVNYVGRDPRDIADANAQSQLDSAKAAPAADGVSVSGAGIGGGVGGGSLSQDGAKGAFGPGGAGSVGMAGGSASALANGAGFTAQSGKAAMGSAVLSHLPGLPPASKSKVNAPAGRMSAMKYASLNARITKGISGAASVSQGNTHPVMYQLVRASAYTMASAMCKYCANESLAVNNRGWATGETATGAGIITLSGDSGTPVSQDAVNQLINGSKGSGGAMAASAASQQCMDANTKYNNTNGGLLTQMSNITWSGGDPNGPLAAKPSKCCKTGNYNSQVDAWKGLCSQYNSNQAQVNTACGNPPSQDAQDCSLYGHVDTCDWFSCYIMTIIGAILIIAAVIVAIVAGVFTGGAGFLLIMILIAAAVAGAGMIMSDLMGGGGGGGGGAPSESGSAPSSGVGAGAGAGSGGGGNQNSQTEAGGVPDSGMIGTNIGNGANGTGGQSQTDANVGNSVNVSNQNTNTNTNTKK